jgi:cell division protein FtsB
MKEQAIKGAGQLVDYGVLGIFCLILLAGFLVAALLIKKNYERHLKEKDAQLAKAEVRIDELEKEINSLRDKVEHRLGDLLDNCGDAIHENSKALYENAAITNEVKGVLLSIHELMKNK